MTGPPRAADRVMMALAVASGVASMGLFAWDGRPTLVPLEGIARWVVLALNGLAAALLVVSGYAVRRTLDLFGLRPVGAHRRGELPRQAPFSVDGPFRWVRHPLYGCILALLWIRPEFMADGLLLSMLWGAWIVAGTVLEERDLVADFGDVYRRYQRQVPMLVPWRGPVR